MISLRVDISKNGSLDIQKTFQSFGDIALSDFEALKTDVLEEKTWYRQVKEASTIFKETPNAPLLLFRGLPQVKSRQFSFWFATLLGVPTKFEGEGDFVIVLKPDETANLERPAFNNRLKFPLHTDMSYVEAPPTSFLLRVVEREANIGGTSLFCSVNTIISNLDSDTLNILSKPLFKFIPPRHYTGRDDTLRPIIENICGRPTIRFRKDAIYTECEKGKRAVTELAEIAEANQMELELQRNDLCVVDNRYLLHGRRPVAYGAKRILHRVYFRGD